jgi:hypothetical protein
VDFVSMDHSERFIGKSDYEFFVTYIRFIFQTTKWSLRATNWRQENRRARSF